MADIKIVDEQGQEVQEDQGEISGEPEMTLYPTGRLLEESVAKLFNLTPAEMSGYRDKLRTLIQYAKYKTDDHSPEGIKWALRHAGMKLGTPPLGERPIDYLHVYAKLYVQEQHIKERRERFLKGDTDE